MEERLWAIEQAALTYHGEIPVEVVLAVAGAETGPPYEWSNEQGVGGQWNSDGIMQVTSASGNKSVAAYVNTRASIEANIRDGVAGLTWNLTTIRNQEWGDYGDVFDDLANAEIIRAILHYNGGNNPIATFVSKQGRPDYLDRVADSLEQIVPSTFGTQYANPNLVQELRIAQQQVYQLLPADMQP